MKLFVDSRGWLILGDKKDPLHAAVERMYRERSAARGRIITSDYRLDETMTRTFRGQPYVRAWRFLEAILESAAAGFMVIESVTEARFARAVELRRRFEDKPAISFTDLTSMVIMKELHISDVLTADRHFAQAGLGFRLSPEPARS